MLFVHPGLCNAPSGRGVTGSQRLRGASRMLARERHRRVWRQNAHASDESPVLGRKGATAAAAGGRRGERQCAGRHHRSPRA